MHYERSEQEPTLYKFFYYKPQLTKEELKKNVREIIKKSEQNQLYKYDILADKIYLAFLLPNYIKIITKTKVQGEDDFHTIEEGEVFSQDFNIDFTGEPKHLYINGRFKWKWFLELWKNFETLHINNSPLLFIKDHKQMPNISSLILEQLQKLQGVLLRNHKNIQSLIISDCPTLKTIEVPQTLQELKIEKLPMLEIINFPENSQITHLVLHNASDSLIFDVSAVPNVTTISLKNVKIKNSFLSKTLKAINLQNVSLDEKSNGILDLIVAENLSSITINNAALEQEKNQIEQIRFYDKAKIEEIDIRSCNALKELVIPRNDKDLRNKPKSSLFIESCENLTSIVTPLYQYVSLYKLPKLTMLKLPKLYDSSEQKKLVFKQEKFRLQTEKNNQQKFIIQEAKQLKTIQTPGGIQLYTIQQVPTPDPDQKQTIKPQKKQGAHKNYILWIIAIGGIGIIGIITRYWSKNNIKDSIRKILRRLKL